VLVGLEHAIEEAKAALEATSHSHSDTFTKSTAIAQPEDSEPQSVPEVVEDWQYREEPARTSNRGSVGHSSAAATAQQHQRSEKDLEPDFAQLARRYPELAPFVRIGPGGRGSIDFTNFEAAR